MSECECRAAQSRVGKLREEQGSSGARPSLRSMAVKRGGGSAVGVVSGQAGKEYVEGNLGDTRRCQSLPGSCLPHGLISDSAITSSAARGCQVRVLFRFGFIEKQSFQNCHSETRTRRKRTGSPRPSHSPSPTPTLHPPAGTQHLENRLKCMPNVISACLPALLQGGSGQMGALVFFVRAVHGERVFIRA